MMIISDNYVVYLLTNNVLKQFRYLYYIIMNVIFVIHKLILNKTINEHLNLYCHNSLHIIKKIIN